MISYCTNYLATMPDITVYMNCDTRLAINLRMFNLGEHDEFIFAIKNFNYIESPYVFLFRARKGDENENGEVIFKISPEASKKIKPGAFYNFCLLTNVTNRKEPSEYKKLTENGNVIVEYGAQDLFEPTPDELKGEIINVRLEQLSDDAAVDPSDFKLSGKIIGIQLERLD